MGLNSNYFLFKKPDYIPCTVSIHIPASVSKMDPAPNFETNEGNLAFIISPAFTISTLVKRRLVFSKVQEVMLSFSYLHVGTVTINREKIYLFLEKI